MLLDLPHCRATIYYFRHVAYNLLIAHFYTLNITRSVSIEEEHGGRRERLVVVLLWDIYPHKDDGDQKQNDL